MTSDRGAILAALWPDEPRDAAVYVLKAVDPDWREPWPLLDIAERNAPAPKKRHPCAQVASRPAFTSERPLTKRQRRRIRGKADHGK